MKIVKVLNRIQNLIWVFITVNPFQFLHAICHPSSSLSPLRWLVVALPSSKQGTLGSNSCFVQVLTDFWKQCWKTAQWKPAHTFNRFSFGPASKPCHSHHHGLLSQTSFCSHFRRLWTSLNRIEKNLLICFAARFHARKPPSFGKVRFRYSYPPTPACKGERALRRTTTAGQHGKTLSQRLTLKILQHRSENGFLSSPGHRFRPQRLTLKITPAQVKKRGSWACQATFCLGFAEIYVKKLCFT